MPTENLIPVAGCWIVRAGTKTPLGQVAAQRTTGSIPEVLVQWPEGKQEWLNTNQIRSGIQNKWTVQDRPLSASRKPLGMGTVVGTREIGGREQVLVQLHTNGKSTWLPYQTIIRVKDAKLRFARQESGQDHSVSRFQLKLLAHALESWNSLTGALDRLDVDPLPHQIQLVHRILSSGNYNWLIADDVGLGKTIEVGLLLAALKRKGFARRVLIIAPAGLTRQWQDEMKFKFEQQYLIYGQDFKINDAQHWKMHDHVIASIDLAKRDEHLDLIRQAGSWDVVIFDEGHKLTRYASGERAQRYRLAETLRPLSDAFLLLSGTPHQGYADRFAALLELVRPDLKKQLRTLEANPEIVSELILRNRKSEVTDADGKFIFHGLKVHRVPVDPSTETKKFNKLLREYLTQGYRAGSEGGNATRAIGFVMTTYRKLASSSIAAIENALVRRRDRIMGLEKPEFASGYESAVDEEDAIEGSDAQDSLEEVVSTTEPKAFFTRELELINGLLEESKNVRRSDEKLNIFLDKVVEQLNAEGKKLLVFTEYRATQSYLKTELEKRYPQAGAVLLINGSMKLEEKLEVIKLFNTGPNRFLLSTEAGGEGLNLHRACHTMVNYDLPWNPARLVQRMGRLYRYGQTLPVVVFNLHAKDSFDNAAIDLMMDRVSQIVQDLSPVGKEFNDRLYAEILGEVLENMDFASVLNSANEMNLERSREQINAAVDNARRAKELQDEIFAHTTGFDRDALKSTQGLTMNHVNTFIRGALHFAGVMIDGETHGKRILELRLPDSLKGKFPAFGQRTVLRVTTDRRLAQDHKDIVLLDFEHSFFQYLVEMAQSENFDGVYTSLRSSHASAGTLAAYKLRWQNDQGAVLSEEFLSVFRNPDGSAECNPAFFMSLLTSECTQGSPTNADQTSRAKLFDELTKVADDRLGSESTKFKHPNSLVPIASADLYE
jgi:ERCC4-related helicase